MNTFRNGVKKFSIISSILLMVAVVGVGYTVFAQGPSQEEINAQMQAQGEKQNAPSEEQIKQFEQQFGGPPASFPEPVIQKPAFEQPGTIPEDIKKYTTDKDLVAIYCAMSRWKSGQFFSAMDAVKKYVIEPTQQVKNDFGLNITIPDVDAIKNEGSKKLEGICNASTVGEAEKLAADFANWGQTRSQAQFDDMRAAMQSQLAAKGDALRSKVKTELQPFIDEQTASIKKEVSAIADQVVEQKKAEITARLAGAKSAPDVSGLQAEITSAVNAAINARVEQKKADLQNKVQAKVQELIGAEKAKFEKIGGLFKNVDQKINASIADNQGQYDRYKKQAFELRMKLVLDIVDKNLSDGMAKLDASAADLAEANKNDPTVKSAGEIKAQLQGDRQALVAKLGAALEAGNESAFQQALNDFRVKWETIQKEGEKAMQQSVSKVCTIALAQFQQANAQMDPGIKKINDLQAKCTNSTTDECLKVNEFSSRFETITSKFADLKTEMSLASKICQNPQTADRANMIALMKKIQSDAEDVKVYGNALNAEKSKMLADTASQICSLAIPQLDAAENEIKKNDLTALQNNANRCKGKTTQECTPVNKLIGDLASLKTKIASFDTNAQKAKALCSSATNENDFKTLSDILYGLKSDGAELRTAAQDLQAKQSEQMNSKLLCRAVVPQLADAKQQIAGGLSDMNTIRSSCNGKSDQRCSVINANANKFDELNKQATQTLKKIADINGMCTNASVDTMDQGLVDALDGLRSDKDAIDKMIAGIKTLEAEAGKGGGISIEAENEATSFIYPLSQRPASNTKEINPSWRPPYFGSGSWYLAAGGEYLTYTFTAPKDGQYNVWVRDYVDNFQARGIRRIVMSFDGKSYGVFAENTATVPSGNRNGVFAWHKVGSGVQLKAGTHTMKVMKESTTRGAAILDSFYLTTGSDTPSEK